MSDGVLNEFRFSNMPVPGTEARVGLMSFPGYREAVDVSDDLLAEDVEFLVTEKVRFVVNCVPQDEMPVPPARYFSALTGSEILWVSLPIPDMTAPDASIYAELETHLWTIRQMMETGMKPAIHCLHGLGRTGTIAALLLVTTGMQPVDAIRYVRENHDSRAIETEAQEKFIQRFSWRTPHSSRHASDNGFPAVS